MTSHFEEEQIEFDRTGLLGDSSYPIDMALEATDESASFENLEEEGVFGKLGQTVRFLLLALVFLMPVFVLPFTAPGDVIGLNKYVLIFGLVLASVVLWLVMIVRQGGVRLKTSGLELGILAFLGTGLVAAIFSDQVYRSFTANHGFIITASLAVFSFLLLHFFEKREIGRVTDCFTAGASLAVLAGVLSLYGAPVFKWIPGGLYSTVGSINNLGALAVLLLVMIVARSFDPSVEQAEDLSNENKLNWLKPVIRWGGAVVSAALILVLNWGVFYGVLAAGMGAIILGLALKHGPWEGRPKFKTANLIGPLVILAVSLLLLISGRYFSFGFPGRQNLPVEVAISQKGSLEIAKGVFSTDLPFGVGQDNFSLAFDKFKPSGVNESVFWETRFGNAASEFWNLIIQTGVVGLAGLFFLLFYTFRSFLRNWSAVAPAFIASLVLFALFPFNIVLHFVFWLLIGLLGLAASREAPEERKTVSMDEISPGSVLCSLAFVLVLVFGLAGGYLIFKKYEGEIHFAQAARTDLANIENIDQAINRLGRSVNANPIEIRYLNGLARLFLTRINAEAGNKTDKPEEVASRVQNLARLAVQTANQMIADQPKDAQNWSSAGFVYENLIGLVGGADQAALKTYTEYLKRAPKDPAIYTRIGNIYLRRADTRRSQKGDQKEVTQDYKNAEENYKKAVELKRDFALAIYNLGVVYDRQAQTKSAIKQLELTKLLDPNSAGLAFELGLLYYRDGQKDNALYEIARAVNLSKDFANARWYLALILEERGQIDLAIAQLKEILNIEVNKDNKIVIDKLSVLQSGRQELPPARVTNRPPLQ